MLLKDKVCLVTGANRGIGAAIIKRFAEEGAIVYASARKPESLAGMAASLSESTDGSVFEQYFDVTDSTAARQAIMQIKQRQGHLDVLINNAGIMEDARIGMISRALLEKTFTTNVYACIEMMQLATKLMKRQCEGSVINFTSIVGVNGSPGQVTYSASKGAVISMTKSAAKELSEWNIRVNAVSPGMIETDLFRSIGEESIAENVKKIGFKRLGKPDEVADTCVYLASDLSRYVTGQIIGVDGSAVL